MGKNAAVLARIISGLMAEDLAAASSRHLNLEVFNVVIHTETVTDTPPALEHSARHGVRVQPCFVVNLHGDLSLPLEHPSREACWAILQIAMEIP
jgi:hypothetical protein